MDPLAGAAGVAALVSLATLIGLVLRRRSSRVKRGDGSGQALDPADFGLDRFGPAGAVVQFSTEFCSRCPGVQRHLSALSGQHASLQFLHLDVTRKPEVATKYRLLQTPTVLTIGSDGILRSRLSGALTREQLAAAVNELTGESP
ncbi:thioredoxin family protein [Leucobacter sp. CSA2]|uniref:Thioredoxin family protein n=1 Tax=Leucobacter edaphi TaxID=2796472 RepID=A0A934QEJ9_9MICO|nr:thioredoxin family protein [Leucobacter edaphi]